MKQTIRWEKEEAIILLNYLLHVKNGEMERSEAIKTVSSILRQTALDAGLEIDIIFRNVNGITLQMSTIEYLLTDGKTGLKKSSYPAVFKEVVNDYKTDSAVFFEQADKLLSNDTQGTEDSLLFCYKTMAAKYNDHDASNGKKPRELRRISQVKARPVSKERPKTNVENRERQAFMRWLKKNGHSPSSILSVISLLDQCSKMTMVDKAHIDFFLVGSEKQFRKAISALKDSPAFDGKEQAQKAKYAEALSLLLEYRGWNNQKQLVNDLKDRAASKDELVANSDLIKKFGILLTNYFSEDGYKLENPIFKARVKMFYAQTFNCELEIENDQIDKYIKMAGIENDGRVYPNHTDSQLGLLDSIMKTVNELFESGATAVYLSCIFEKFQNDLISAHIYDEDALFNALLERSNGGIQKKGKPAYLCSSAVNPEPQKMVAKLIRSFYQPQQLDKLQKELWYIPPKKVADFLKWDDEVVSASKKYFYSANLPISDEDLEYLRKEIGSRLINNSYVSVNDIQTIMGKMPLFVLDTAEFSPDIIWKCLKVLLKNDFSFQGKTVSSKGPYVSSKQRLVNDIKNRDSISFEELSEFANALNMQIPWDSILLEMVRVSANELKRRDLFEFDVDLIDQKLNEVCTGDYMLLRDFDLFLGFPNVGVKWNIFLLESYLYSESKAFKLAHSSFSNDTVCGVMLRASSFLKDYTDVITDSLSRLDIRNMSENDILDYLVSNGFQRRRKLTGLDAIVNEAKRLADNKQGE